MNTKHVEKTLFSTNVSALNSNSSGHLTNPKLSSDLESSVYIHENKEAKWKLKM